MTPISHPASGHQGCNCASSGLTAAQPFFSPEAANDDPQSIEPQKRWISVRESDGGIGYDPARRDGASPDAPTQKIRFDEQPNFVEEYEELTRLFNATFTHNR